MEQSVCPAARGERAADTPPPGPAQPIAQRPVPSNPDKEYHERNDRQNRGLPPAGRRSKGGLRHREREKHDDGNEKRAAKKLPARASVFEPVAAKAGRCPEITPNAGATPKAVDPKGQGREQQVGDADPASAPRPGPGGKPPADAPGSSTPLAAQTGSTIKAVLMYFPLYHFRLLDIPPLIKALPRRAPLPDCVHCHLRIAASAQYPLCPALR